MTRLVLLAAACATLMPWSAHAQAPTFRTRTELVRLDVLVSSRGQPVRNLTIADFEIRDQGVVQQLEFISFEELPLNVLLVCDMSSSLTEAEVNNVQNAARAVLTALKGHDRVGLITFGGRVTEQQRLTEDHALVRATLATLKPSGVTALNDAIFAGATLLGAEPGRSLVLVFSDGVDTASWLSHERVMDAIKSTPVTVYSASVGDGASAKLSEIAQASGGRHLILESARNLEATFAAFLAEFRERYVLGYEPTAKLPTGGWHRVDVRVKRPNVTVQARPGYQSRP